MSYATLMVHLDLDRSNDTRLRIAGELAARFDARLIGVAAGDIQAPLYFAEGNIASDLLEQEQAWLKSRIADREAEFRGVLKALAGRLEWRSAVEWPVGFVARNARAADLLIIGGTAARGEASHEIDAGELVMRVGRPVLIVPSGTEWLKLKTVVVAWKDTREARRAVNDALPLLHLARDVVVIELIEADADQAAAKARVDDVAGWLTRRKINASSITAKALIGVTGQLSIFAQDEGADIIVAGAYGHTRFQEWLFGGVTRELLSQKKHSVLLSNLLSTEAPGELQMGDRMKMINRTVSVAALLAGCLYASDHGVAQTLSPSAQRGLVFVQANCARCHSVGKLDASPLAIAPPFRTLHTKYPVESLEEALAEGIVSGHPTMPEFRLDPGQIQDLISYLKTLER